MGYWVFSFHDMNSVNISNAENPLKCCLSVVGREKWGGKWIPTSVLTPLLAASATWRPLRLSYDSGGVNTGNTYAFALLSKFLEVEVDINCQPSMGQPAIPSSPICEKSERFRAGDSGHLLSKALASEALPSKQLYRSSSQFWRRWTSRVMLMMSHRYKTI